MNTRLVVRVYDADEELFWALQARSRRLWSDLFSEVVVVTPHDRPARWTEQNAPAGVRVHRFGFNEYAASPMTGLALLECVRLAAEPGFDFAMVSEADVLLFDPHLISKYHPEEDVLLVSGVCENLFPTRFDGPCFFGLPAIGTQRTWSRLWAVAHAVGMRPAWQHADRMLTKLSELAYIPGRSFTELSCLGRVDSTASFDGVAARVVGGIPLFHAIKSVEMAERLVALSPLVPPPPESVLTPEPVQE